MYNAIFALVSAEGTAAVAAFRVSGKGSNKILLSLIRNKNLPKARSLILKKIYYPNLKNKILDTCLICWMPAPKSYTGEDCFEIHCHGGATTSKAFFNLFSSIKGLRHAEAGEFSRRALVNGKIDLIKAEAINDIIMAETEKQRELAVRQLNEGLSIPINLWRQDIIKILSKIEATIDFSDEEDVPEKIETKNDLKSLSKNINAVLNEGERYELISEGAKIALTGLPNSGKSSLFNNIIKNERSIVTKIPGTTRDVIEKKINLKGYAITFYDTAGIRETKDVIEKEGIKKALNAVKEADLVLNIVDLTIKNSRNLNKTSSKTWNVFNKIDKYKSEKLEAKTNKKEAIWVSAKTGEGVKELLEKIHRHVFKKSHSNTKERYFFTNLRQKNDLKNALHNIQFAILEKEEEIAAEHLRLSLNDLERILGKFDVEEVLGNIFSNFCIGK